MASTSQNVSIASCSCGGVQLEAVGAPIVGAVCYCDDCQAGARQIEALPNAAPVRGRDGGTAYLLYRRDRVTCTRGSSLLKNLKLKESSVTNRVVATCCNSAMYVGFDKGPFWYSVYRARFKGNAPVLEMRLQTKYLPKGVQLPGDIPNYSAFPMKLAVKLVFARVAMLFGR